MNRRSVPPKEAWPLMGIDDLWPVVGGHEGDVVWKMPLLLDRSSEPL